MTARHVSVPAHLLRQLLNRNRAHVILLAAYRAGTPRAPAASIDTLTQTRDIPAQVEALLEELSADRPVYRIPGGLTHEQPGPTPDDQP